MIHDIPKATADKISRSNQKGIDLPPGELAISWRIKYCMWCRRLTFCDIIRILFSSSGVRRQIFRTKVSMVTGGDVVERLEKRAVEAEETISLLKSQLLFLQKAAGL